MDTMDAADTGLKAIVVGSGMAGLSAAYTLMRAGWHVVVLEAAGYAGGRSATVRANGYSIDTAATLVSRGYTEYVALCEEVGLGAELIPCSQIIGFVRDQRIHELDMVKRTSALLSPIISLRSKLSILKTIIDKQRMKPKLQHLNLSASHEYDDESVAAYARRSMSSEAYEYLVGPMLRANLVRTPDKVSKLEWFAFTENFTGHEMLSVRGGTTRLPTLLASKVDTRLNSPAQRVELMGNKVAVTWLENGIEKNASVDACVIATRLPEAIKISPAYAEIAGPLSDKHYYSRGLLVHLGFRQVTKSKALVLYIPVSEQNKFSVIFLEHNKGDEVAPEGHSLITCYFDGACVDDYYSLPDQKIIDIALSYLETLFPELIGESDFARISRWPLAIAFPEPGVYKEIHKLKSKLSPQDRIQYVGDYFTSVGQNSAIHSGKRAAENLLANCRSAMPPHSPDL